MNAGLTNSQISPEVQEDAVQELSLDKARYADLEDHRSNDRVLVLQVEEGKKPLTSMGVPDPRLFNGENKLHAIMDNRTSLWYLKYDMGVLPGALKQKFTSFSKLYKYVSDYYGRRGLKIVEVIE